MWRVKTRRKKDKNFGGYFERILRLKYMHYFNSMGTNASMWKKGIDLGWLSVIMSQSTLLALRTEGSPNPRTLHSQEKPGRPGNCMCLSMALDFWEYIGWVAERTGMGLYLLTKVPKSTEIRIILCVHIIKFKLSCINCICLICAEGFFLLWRH